MSTVLEIINEKAELKDRKEFCEYILQNFPLTEQEAISTLKEINSIKIHINECTVKIQNRVSKNPKEHKNVRIKFSANNTFVNKEEKVYKFSEEARNNMRKPKRKRK